MLVSVVKIGNSRGIRLPKNILQRLNIEDKVELELHADELRIKRVEKKPRQGWHEAFAKMSEKKADKLILPEYIDDKTFDWVW